MVLFSCLKVSQNSKISSGVFRLECIIIPSAPALTYALARLSASSIPCSRIRLSIRAIIMKSSVLCASLPALIFSQKCSMLSCVCTTSVPNNEFFLRPVLSSMITADTPTLSSVLTLYTKCSVSPPVSPSRIIGLVVTSSTSSIVRSLDDISTSSMSGLPLSVASHRLDIHIASNCLNSLSFCITVFSAIRPVSPLWTSQVLTIGQRLISCLSLLRLNSGIASFCVICASILRILSLYV